MIEITLTFWELIAVIVVVAAVAPFIKGFFEAMTHDLLKWLNGK